MSCYSENRYETGKGAGRCRSAFMRTEEINRERAMSGWNPYAGEEEYPRPYYRRMDYAGVLEEMKTAEKDFRRIQSMYPEMARKLLPYVEEACDKLEYEGSVMFDEYPDPTAVWRMQEEILGEAGELLEVEEEAGPEAVVTMQYHGRRRRPPRRGRAEELIRVLLLQEMHHRRCRYQKCRKGWGY